MPAGDSVGKALVVAICQGCTGDSEGGAAGSGAFLSLPDVRESHVPRRWGSTYDIRYEGHASEAICIGFGVHKGHGNLDGVGKAYGEWPTLGLNSLNWSSFFLFLSSFWVVSFFPCSLREHRAVCLWPPDGRYHYICSSCFGSGSFLSQHASVINASNHLP